jgi:hypothetical protein
VLADKAVRALAKVNQDDSQSKDPLERMLHISNNEARESNGEICDFIADASRYPPIGCGALSQAWYDDKAMRNEKVLERDERAEEKAVLQRARTFFLSNASILATSLLHAGLIGGFASPRIVKVLSGTGYLLSSKEQRDKRGTYTQRMGKEEAQKLLDEVTVSNQRSKDRVFRRLLETLHFMLDIMEDESSLCPPCSSTFNRFDDKRSQLTRRAGVGWLAATKVRLLHAGVRMRLCPNGLNGTEEVVPISQDEMIGTLCLFSVATLSSLDRMGLSASNKSAVTMSLFGVTLGTTWE